MRCDNQRRRLRAQSAAVGSPDLHIAGFRKRVFERIASIESLQTFLIAGRPINTYMIDGVASNG